MNIQFIKNKLRYIKRFLFGSPSNLNDSFPPSEIEFISNFLEENNTVFDIGANIGLWSFCLSQLKLNLNILFESCLSQELPTHNHYPKYIQLLEET